MQLHVLPRFQPSLQVIRCPLDVPGALGRSRQTEDEILISRRSSEEASYLTDRAEVHERMAREAKHPAARAAHLELAERYRERAGELADASDARAYRSRAISSLTTELASLNV